MSLTRADLWEKSEITKIKERYQILYRTIIEWEIKKKEKARRKLKKIEEELERKKAKAIWEYNSELMRIDQIVGEAQAQAQEKQRNDEFKAKDKANKIRARE